MNRQRVINIKCNNPWSKHIRNKLAYANQNFGDLFGKLFALFGCSALIHVRNTDQSPTILDALPSRRFLFATW